MAKLNRKNWDQASIRELRLEGPDLVDRLFQKLRSGGLSDVQRASALVILGGAVTPAFYPERQGELIGLAVAALDSSVGIVRDAGARVLVSVYYLVASKMSGGREPLRLARGAVAKILGRDVHPALLERAGWLLNRFS